MAKRKSTKKKSEKKIIVPDKKLILPYEGVNVVITGGSIDSDHNPNHERGSGIVDAIIPNTNSIIPYFLNERVNVFVQPTVDGLIKGDDSDSKYIITETIRVGFGVYFPSEMSFFPN